jgi:hypothetical protein
MLRRFLMALFALHFLLSVGGFTLHIPSPVRGESALTADVDGLGSSIQHGLTDDAPDIPDCSVCFLLTLKTPRATRPTTSWVLNNREDPTPLGRDRPPKRSARA